MEFEEDTKSLRDYLGILRRRKWPMLWIACLLFLASVIVAMVLPPVYRSTTTILLESQDIARDLVKSTGVSHAAERIDAISREVMTKSNLIRLIEKHKLYVDEKGSTPAELLIGKLRKAVSIELVSSKLADSRSKRSNDGATTFTISFEGSKPELVQRVADELASLYVSGNAEQRTRKAAAASGFLAKEMDKLRGTLAKVEDKLADFKARNVGALPEHSAMNMRLAESSRRDISNIDQQLRSLKERQYYLEGQLALVKPNAPIQSTDGRMVLDDEARIRMLRSEYARLSAKYDASHPDVTRLQREIAALEQGAGSGGGMDPRVEELHRMRDEFAAKSSKYSSQHPDVKKLRRHIASLEAELEQSPPSRGGSRWSSPAESADNPAYVALHSQLKSINSEISSLWVQRRGLEAQVSSYEQRLVKSPHIEQEYTNLVREKENTLRRYQDVEQKLRNAQLSQELEKDSAAERLILLEPALLPLAPIKPNRLAIVFLGFIFSIAGGVGYAAVAESLDHSINGRHALSTLLGEPPLAVVPYIEIEQEGQGQMKLATIGLLAGSAVLLIAVIYFFWGPLDALRLVAMKNIGM